jgi:hypothetical protein
MALRSKSPAGALTVGGIDVVAISRRLGHGKPNVTLDVHSYPFRRDDSAAAAMMRTRRDPCLG